MYYRRKVILAVLEQFGGEMPEADLQSALFLLCDRQEEPSFEFLPVKTGPYSFQAEQDLLTMEKYEQVGKAGGAWRLLDETGYAAALKPGDRFNLTKLYGEIKSVRGAELQKRIFSSHPYYAINLGNAGETFGDKEQEEIDKLKPKFDEPALFTIGYEGKSVEKYANQLIANDVRALCDVRRNPLSMKFGFSKAQLKRIVESVGIAYIHIPALGIDSSKRKDVSTPEEREALFDYYENTFLPERQEELDYVDRLYREYGRIALTCFEADPNDCHRSRVANALGMGWKDIG